jgi:hypothetical protein
MMKISLFGLAASLFLTMNPARADISTANMTPAQIQVALTAIAEAKRIALSGRGSLLLAGDVLATAEAPAANVLTIIEYPDLAQLEPGQIMLFARQGCAPIEDCLLARRYTGRDASGEIHTESYGSSELLLLGRVQATLLGVVDYAIDLETGRIRDMRAAQQSKTLAANWPASTEVGAARH